MKTKTPHSRGTTLVEITVASVLLVSIIGLITLALAVVFESYAITQQRNVIDQDSQYILARFKYIASQQDTQTVYTQMKTEDFTQVGATLTNLEAGQTEEAGIFLSNTSLPGEYTSPIISLSNPTLARYFVASVQRPTGSDIQYQIAMADPVSGSCENANFVYVGEGTSETEFFTADYFSIPQDDNSIGFENPGACIRYKIFLSTTSGETPIVKGAIVRR